MGYTHHDAISATGTGGIAVGAKGSETRLIDSDGKFYKASGTQLDTAEGILNFNIVNAAGTGITQWFVAPYAATISANVTLSVSSGTGRTVAVVHGSAGDNALGLAATGATGTIGKVVALTASVVPTCTASEPMRIVTSTCATAQLYGVTLTFTKT